MRDEAKGLVAWAVLFVAGIAAGLGLGWKLWGGAENQPKVETYAPPVRQADGSLVLERKPMTEAQAAAVAHRPQIPEGGQVERQVEVVVQPHAQVSPENEHDAADMIKNPGNVAPIPPIRVDLALVRMPDDSRRVVASTPDGTITGGLDIPLEPSKPVKAHPWAAGGSWNPADRTAGAWVERDLSFLRVGADLHQVRLDSGRMTWAGMVRVGVRW